ncbi:MAG: 2-C-methyl-D-erythritol 4-phosphate cytidylyltransferase [Bacteroidales bacterium]|nr:2-C-methyl-D-erythritol 4-phosphate cytidylyltransferase [Bacteroidales bacterium]
MKKFIIVTAGGSGKRMNAGIPKQFILLNNLPILMHTINTFFDYSNKIKIVLVLPETSFETWDELCKKYNFQIPHQLIKGGETRFQSVKNGLSVISEECLIAVHDGVRPFVKKEVIRNCFETAEKLGNAVPVITINESIREIKNSQNLPADRENFRIVQTPQIFRSSQIKIAYKQDFCEDFTDDASVVESTGIKINLVEGNPENIKITRQADIKIAKAFF